MALGRRKKGKSDAEEEPAAETSEELATSAELAGASEAGFVPEAPAPRRPLDESEVGEGEVGEGEVGEGEAGGGAESAAATMPRLDLGCLRIPVLPDLEVRVELNPQQQPVAASVLHAGSAVQILAFAAPRGDGIWDDVRAEIAESVRNDGGTSEETDGVFGRELHARVRGEVQPGQVVEQQLRFVGFDGPRWFVRAVFSGPAATNPQQAKALEAVLTSVVVVRGSEPMAPRDPLPLQLPRDVAGIPQPPPAAPASLDPLERGPEITETR